MESLVLAKTRVTPVRRPLEYCWDKLLILSDTLAAIAKDAYGFEFGSRRGAKTKPLGGCHKPPTSPIRVDAGVLG
jgi:hypothetical protein